jgi:hypothetical protein
MFCKNGTGHGFGTINPEWMANIEATAHELRSNPTHQEQATPRRNARGRDQTYQKIRKSQS